jgi:KUP system potassium uptake protein
MSHFGRGPIALAWSAVAFPALAINYIGQGALVLSDPRAVADPFYGLVPPALLYPVVGIATAATVIASQALISGVATLTKQAIELGFIPRLKIIYTSVRHRGQVFVPTINAVLGLLCIALVLGFRSSARLADAYGLAVSATMMVTTVAFYVVVRGQFQWSALRAASVTAPILAVESLFVIGSLHKIREGGWIPLLISLIVFTIASTWRTGRRRVAQSYAAQSVPVEQFLDEVRGRPSVRLKGTAVFLTGDSEGVPFVLRHHWARSHSLDERIVLLTIHPSNDPHLSDEKRVVVDRVAENLVRVTADFGFMERLDIAPIVRSCREVGLDLASPDTTFYIADPVIVPAKKGRWRNWRRGLYIFLRRNASPITQNLGIPADQLAKLGLEVPM